MKNIATANAPKPRATLDELAHLNRCLFPENLLNDLMAAEGVSEGAAREVVNFYSKNCRIGLVGLYQEFIQDPVLTAAFERLLDKHLAWLRGHQAEQQSSKEVDLDYSVTVTLSVTAETAELAAKYALDDLRDTSIGPWTMVAENSAGATTVTIAEPC